MSFLLSLEKLIKERQQEKSNDSYTRKALLRGHNGLVKKLGEEFAELIQASSRDDKEEVIKESADWIFHLLLLLRFHELSWEDIEGELKGRKRNS